MKLLSVSADAKTVKGEKKGFLTGILYLAPHTLAGIGNVCPDATPGCMAGCLYRAGRGVFTSVEQGRIRKARMFKADRVGFMTALVKDITALVRKAKRSGLTPVVRLNGTSDLPWENIALPAEVAAEGFVGGTILAKFPSVQFYDYTKSARRMLAFTRGELPANYHLTFSRSERNDADAYNVLDLGGSVAVVFDTKRGDALPATWQGFRVVDGDTSDLRFADKADKGFLSGDGFVVGLRAKGPARRDRSGFVVNVEGDDGLSRQASYYTP